MESNGLVPVISSSCGLHSSDDPKLIRFHETHSCLTEVTVLEDDPPMNGFGKALKKGDKVKIQGTIWCPMLGCFAVNVPAECAFYDYTYFE